MRHGYHAPHANQLKNNPAMLEGIYLPIHGPNVSELVCLFRWFMMGAAVNQVQT